MHNRKIIILFFLIILLPKLILGQNDTTDVNRNKIIFQPSLFGFQIEAISSLVFSEFGALLDYDLYSSPNKKHNFGLRLSTEYYDMLSLDVGGKSAPGPFWDFNIYGRHSIRGENFWFSPLLGFSIHNSLEKEDSDVQILLKWGLELKYNLYKDNVGLLLKFAFPFNGKVGYLGIGISIGAYNK